MFLSLRTPLRALRFGKGEMTMTFLEVAALLGLLGGAIAGTFTITWMVAKDLFLVSRDKDNKKD